MTSSNKNPGSEKSIHRASANPERLNSCENFLHQPYYLVFYLWVLSRDLLSGQFW